MAAADYMCAAFDCTKRAVAVEIVTFQANGAGRSSVAFYGRCADDMPADAETREWLAWPST